MRKSFVQLALMNLVSNAFHSPLPSAHAPAVTPAVSVTIQCRQSTSATTALWARKHANPFNRKAVKKKPHANRNTEDTSLLGTDDNDEPWLPADPLVQKRDRALLALYSNLDMPIHVATSLLDKYPPFYEDIPNLATRLLYLLEEVHIPKAKLSHMMTTHPTMMVKVILEDPERSLTSTAEVLQTELHLTLEEISNQQQLVQMDRLNLKGKLNQLKQYFEIPQLQQLIRQHSELLTGAPKDGKELKEQILALSDALELSDEELAQTLRTTDPILLKRDRALLSLQSNLGMDLSSAMVLLDDFPKLYTGIPSLSTRLLYLSSELNLSKKKVLGLIARHPAMMVRVLLDDPEVSLSSTVQVLQDELQISLDEFTKKGATWQLDRMELRPKLTFLKQYLKAPSLKRMVLKNPAVLGASSSFESMKGIVTMLQSQLALSDEELGVMLKRLPKLLDADPGQIEKSLTMWTVGPIGQGLQKIVRKGISAKTATAHEADKIGRLRAKEILLKYPALLVSDNVPISVDYLTSIGCTAVNLGKIVYRRPSVLSFSLEIIKTKMEQFRDELGLAMSRTPGSNEKIVVDVMAALPDVFTQSAEDNLQPKFDYFRHDIGLSTEEMRDLFSGRPHILSLSLELNLKPKIEYLRSDEGPGLSPESLREFLISLPDSIRQNLETRIRPRCNMALKRGLVVPQDLTDNFFSSTDKQYEKW
jgi:hypothetical protein